MTDVDIPFTTMQELVTALDRIVTEFDEAGTRTAELRDAIRTPQGRAELRDAADDAVAALLRPPSSMADVDDLVLHSLDAGARRAVQPDAGVRDAELALVAADGTALVERLHASANAFLAEHRVAASTLREDVTGDLRQGGILRALLVLLLFPLALPLGVYVVRNVAGMGFEWLGAVYSVLCVAVVGAIVVILRERPLDRTALGIHAVATASVVAGAALAWATFGVHPIAVVAVVCAVAMLGLLTALLVARLRGGEVGRLRDTEAMDRAHALGAALRARLEADAGSKADDAAVVAFLDELQARAIPVPTRRLFADTSPLDQRTAGTRGA